MDRTVLSDDLEVRRGDLNDRTLLCVCTLADVFAQTEIVQEIVFDKRESDLPETLLTVQTLFLVDIAH